MRHYRNFFGFALAPFYPEKMDGKSLTRNCYSAVVVMIICIPVPISFIGLIKNIDRDGDTYDHLLQLHYFLTFCHPYPSSFHEMIFIVVHIRVRSCITPLSHSDTPHFYRSLLPICSKCINPQKIMHLLFVWFV